MTKEGSWLQRWRVPLGFLCAALFILLAQPRPLTLINGGAVSILGLAVRAWAAGHIRKNTALATSGPYAYTRNPLYFGSFLLGLGFTIGAGQWILLILFAGLFLGIYFPVMRVESGTIAGIFGEDYQRYALEVPLFFPRFTRYRHAAAEPTKFDRNLYLRYREYRAAFGLLFAWGLLAFKAYYLR
ncbi:MAG: methyltransferase family protein [Pyrinomonadaceae bacterium]